MSTEASEGHVGGPGAAAEAPGRPLHARSFKLRFASQRELGRSNVSAVKPLALPATVTGKFYSGVGGVDGEVEAAREAAALARVSDLFRRGPRQAYAQPLTTAHEYGWWSERGLREARWLHHHICDSPWLKARLRVLAADASYKRS